MDVDKYELTTTISRTIKITNFGRVVEGLQYKGFIVRDGWAGEYEREKDQQQFSFSIAVSEGQPKFRVQNLTTSERFESNSSSGPWYQALKESVSGPKMFGLDTKFYTVLVECQVCERVPGSPRELNDFFHELSDGNYVCGDHYECPGMRPTGM